MGLVGKELKGFLAKVEGRNSLKLNEEKGRAILGWKGGAAAEHGQDKGSAEQKELAALLVAAGPLVSIHEILALIFISFIGQACFNGFYFFLRFLLPWPEITGFVCKRAHELSLGLMVSTRLINRALAVITP
ncbi:MAG: hypothetical protein ACPLRR_10355 [Candidatus Saccharicenans sp.]